MASVVSPERTRSLAAFVGRERELSELRAGLDDVSAGHGRLFLLSGEPGIGKTRLAEEISIDAAARGMRVVWGRCWEGGGAPAYWPFVQILRACLDNRDGEYLGALLGSGASEIARLIPELMLSIPSLEEAKAATDSESALFRLFDAIGTLLKDVARSSHLVLILDDLHEADHSSLELLKFVARGLRDSEIVIVGTCRDAEVRRSHELAGLIGDIVRHGHPIPLAGLDENEVTQMIQHRVEHLPSATFASELHRVSTGNPLFVDGVLRVLMAERKLGTAVHLDLSGFKLPEGVRSAIRKQLAALSAGARFALSVAAAIGNDFDVTWCQRVMGASAENANGWLDEASAAEIVRPLGRGRYRFHHALIREALYDEIDTNNRVKLHRRIGEAIEEIHARDLAPHLAALAHHFREAGAVEKAIDYSIRAGDASYAVFAFEEAASHWEAALGLMAVSVGRDLERRAGLLWRLSDDLISKGPRAIGHLEAAGQLYEELGNQEMVSEVHSRLGHIFSSPSIVAIDWNRSMFHFEKAEEYLVKQPESLAYAWLCSQKAAACAYSRRTSEGLSAARRAMEISERGGYASIWVHGALMSSLFLILTGAVTEGLELANEAQQRAELISDTMVGSGVAWVGGGNYLLLQDPCEAQRWYARELANPRTARAAGRRAIILNYMVTACAWTGELAVAHSYLAELSPKKNPQLLYRDGDWEEAERMHTRTCERSHATGDLYSESLNLRHLSELYRVRREYAQAAQGLQRALTIWTEAGDLLNELLARSELALVLPDAGQRDEAVSHLGRCREILSAGEDWRGIAGFVARAEAVVAAAEGKYDNAETQFEKAVEIFCRYHVPFEEAEALHYWGRALNASGEHSRANEKLDAAIEIYRRCGAGERWIERVEADRQPSPARTEKGEYPADVQSQAVFQMEGDYWTIAYEGKTWRLKDAKGLHYIAHLLAHPGEEIRALDLVTRIGGGGEATVEKRSAQDLARSDTVAGDLGHAGEILDAQAKADYQRRLTELEDELEGARALGNELRAEKAEDEMEALGRELKAAIGLAGRDRRSASATERGRIAVTKAIRFALNKIAENDASLGKLLSTTIKTGTVCAYVPDARFPVSWRL